jgi:hypothetical protein
MNVLFLGEIEGCGWGCWLLLGFVILHLSFGICNPLSSDEKKKLIVN